MTWEDAVRYCEDHECTECEVYMEDKEIRTQEEKCNKHIPCCINLVSDEFIQMM